MKVQFQLKALDSKLSVRLLRKGYCLPIIKLTFDFQNKSSVSIMKYMPFNHFNSIYILFELELQVSGKKMVEFLKRQSI